MKLTIGMCCYDDYDGVWFTIQSILMYHRECIDDINFIVVDGNPESNHGKSCEKLIGQLRNSSGNNGLYVKNISWSGTASRQYVFDYAKTPYVLCLDSHVMIAPGAIRKLIDYYDKNPTCDSLIQGPLLNENGEVFATQMQPVWDYNMYGKWYKDDSKINSLDPYPVDMMGLGLFSCIKASWLGFNQKFKGFGGEEGYIHKKYKKYGRETLIMPWLQWNHRFDRPRGVPYHNDYIDRIKNYMIGWHELGEDPGEIIEYYSKENTNPGQERLAINKEDLITLNNMVTVDRAVTQQKQQPELDPTDIKKTPEYVEVSEENGRLTNRIIELEMKIMELTLAPAQAVNNTREVASLDQLEQATTQSPNVNIESEEQPIEQATIEVEQDILDSTQLPLPGNVEVVTADVQQSTSAENQPVITPPPGTDIQQIQSGFEQRLFQQPIQEQFTPPPPVPAPPPVYN